MNKLFAILVAFGFVAFAVFVKSQFENHDLGLLLLIAISAVGGYAAANIWTYYD